MFVLHYTLGEVSGYGALPHPVVIDGSQQGDKHTLCRADHRFWETYPTPPTSALPESPPPICVPHTQPLQSPKGEGSWQDRCQSEQSSVRDPW